MKFYSEKTGELFDTVEELETAEKEIEEIEKAKKAAQEEVNSAYEEAVKAWENYLEVSKKCGCKRAYLPDNNFKTLLDVLFR